MLGTGLAGRTLATGFADRDHDVVLGTRVVDVTAARPEVAEWATATGVPLVDLAAAGAHGEVVVNATNGQASVDALVAAAPPAGTVVLDVSNPLDFSAGFPPTLAVVNTDSVGEQIQRALPEVRVVKTLNTVNAAVMVQPGLLSGQHHVFVAGEDAGAKGVATQLLGELGWPAASVLDLGGIRAARATEMYLPMWLSLMGATGSPVFNIAVVTG